MWAQSPGASLVGAAHALLGAVPHSCGVEACNSDDQACHRSPEVKMGEAFSEAMLSRTDLDDIALFYVVCMDCVMYSFLE